MHRPAKITASNAYEVNIFDQRPDPSCGTGGIVDVAKISPMPKAGGKWNTYEITAKGPQLIVVLNGVKTVDIRDGKFAQGPFAGRPYDPGPARSICASTERAWLRSAVSNPSVNDV